MLLAGFAFESYNQPDIKWEVGADGTRTGMLSPAFIREYYDGLVAIDAIKAQLFRPADLLPLQGLDTYLVLQVGDGEPVRTATVYGSESPEWAAGQTLYVRGSDATLLLSVYYETGPLGEGPKLLGRAQLQVSELGSSIQLWGKKQSLSGGSGRVELKAQAIPFSSDDQIDRDLNALASSVQSGELGSAFDSLSSAFGQWRARRAVIGTTGTSAERRGSTLASTRTDLSNPATWFANSTPRGPRGAAGVDWSEIALRLGGAAAGGDAFEACCFVENTRSNTQCSIFRQAESRTLVLSFRGTQQDEMTDILTDLSFQQRPATAKADEQSVAARQAAVRTREAAEQLEGALKAALASLRADDAPAALDELRQIDALGGLVRTAVEAEREVNARQGPPSSAVADSGLRPYDGPPPMVHSGFYTALKSVLPRLLRLLPQLTADGAGPGSWTVYMTGHSLGGALATLMAWEVEALRERELPSIGRVALYNFGSPRVGNRAFCESFNRAVGEAFRIVNRDDVVARVPNFRLPGGEWQQVGRTVLVRADAPGDTALWVEGEMLGTCPISLDAGDVTSEEAAAAGRRGVGEGGRMKLLRSVFGGQGVGDHLEDAYHAGMGAAVTAWELRKARAGSGGLFGLADERWGLGQEEVAPALAPVIDVTPLDATLLEGIDSIVKEELGYALRRNNEVPASSGATLPAAASSAEGDVLPATAAATAAQPAAEVDEIGLLVERVRERAIQDTRGLTGKERYEVGDITRAVLSSLRSEVSTRLDGGEWSLQDLSLLLRIVLLLAAELTPGAHSPAHASRSPARPVPRRQVATQLARNGNMDKVIREEAAGPISCPSFLRSPLLY